MEVLAVAGGGGPRGSGLSTSRLVSNLNRQLYSMTSAEKYATFCLGIYDESVLHLHLHQRRPSVAPPDSRRRGGACWTSTAPWWARSIFRNIPRASIELRSGDLLVFYTDGVTEPENEYGEMFGEERLIEILIRNAHRREEDIIALVLDSVKQWTATEELQDDMTLLLARRV